MNILFIGGGNMAAAIIGGLIAKGWPASVIHAVDVLPEALKRLAQQFGICTWCNDMYFSLKRRTNFSGFTFKFNCFSDV